MLACGNHADTEAAHRGVLLGTRTTRSDVFDEMFLNLDVSAGLTEQNEYIRHHIMGVLPSTQPVATLGYYHTLGVLPSTQTVATLGYYH